MDIRPITPELSISEQLHPQHLAALQAAGYRSVICNRPDGESPDQPTYAELADAARLLGLEIHHLPVDGGKVSDAQAEAFGALMQRCPRPALAFCRTGTRSATLWALSEAASRPLPEILARAASARVDLKGVVRRIANGGRTPPEVVDASHQVVIVGGGAGGIAVASSLLQRAPGLDIAIIEPADVHYYQPGWTLVGGGVFEAATTARTMASVLPRGVTWIRGAVAAFEPERHAVVLDGCRVVRYEQLVVCPGLKLDWDAIEGLPQTLGRHGVTSNYRYDLAPYTWDLVRRWRGGHALFTQPPMPIKCAGAPQKAMYLACDQWRRRGVLAQTTVDFHNAGGVLFGVADYVPALMAYVERYGIQLNFNERLVAIDGPARRASFVRSGADGQTERFETGFDMIHVVPPQTAPDFVRASPLADAAGWVDVDRGTLQHLREPDVFALGDVGGMPNAKTAAAARKQAPVVATNLLLRRGIGRTPAQYDGYGSCPLTVERGRIVLAEFVYGGKPAPSFPRWLIDGTQPSRTAWWLKERLLPPLYWRAMLKGREWLARPEAAAPADAPQA